MLTTLNVMTAIRTTITTANGDDHPMKGFLADKANLKIPKVGDLVSGVVVGIGRNEVQVDIPGYRTGLVRGNELLDPSGQTQSVAVGAEVEATVVTLENERGFVELSFRTAGHQKAWNALETMRRSGAVTQARVMEANKGGLIVMLGNVEGFLPVSQLSPSNYPRVSGGDRQKIFEKLRTFAGKIFDVKIIDVIPTEEKLIVSEKAAWEESQHQVLSQYHAGDAIDGIVTALADFGAFVRFPIPEQGAPAADDTSYLEGLVHISELSWQRVENPRDIVSIGDRVRVKIINIERSKIFLSLKRMSDDPWVKAAEQYAVGQRVHGKVVKQQPFGLFVELNPHIHGLAHISELGDPPPAKPEDAATIGEEREWTIISLDPKEHRLGLSMKERRTEEQKNGEPEVTMQNGGQKDGEPDVTMQNGEQKNGEPDVTMQNGEQKNGEPSNTETSPQHTDTPSDIPPAS